MSLPENIAITFYASREPLDTLDGFVEITPLSIAPAVGDLICTNDIIGGKKGIFRVRQRMISVTHIRLWVQFLEA